MADRTHANSSVDRPQQLVAVIAALHHSVRRALLSSLLLDGPATVSTLAERTGERVGNISHHVKVLAEAGLALPAPELAKDRRESWWRGNPDPISWSMADVQGDPVGEAVFAAAEQQNLAHHAAVVQQWFAHRDDYAAAWTRAAYSSDGWLAVTPAELQEFGEKITALFREYGATPERDSDPNRERIFAFAHAVPAKP